MIHEPSGKPIRYVKGIEKAKEYQTSLGFFDLAIAAPSMKAAAEAWDSRIDAFLEKALRRIAR